MRKNKLKHSNQVSIICGELAKILIPEKINDLKFLGFIHDIGYDIDENNHAKAGGLFLKNNGYIYWEEVFYHGEPYPTYESLELNILNIADMVIDKEGQLVGFNGRMKDIENRYNIDSLEFKNAKSVLKQIITFLNSLEPEIKEKIELVIKPKEINHIHDSRVREEAFFIKERLKSI